MSVATEEKSTADLRREIAEKERILDSKQHQLKALYEATKNEKGERIAQPHQAEQIYKLESEAQKLVGDINARKMDFTEALNLEAIERRSREPLAPAAIFDERGGRMDDGLAAAAAKGRARQPNSLGEAFVESDTYQRWRHGTQNQVAFTDIQALSVKAFALNELREQAMKATLTTSGLTSIEKFPDVIQLGQQMLTVADLPANAQTNNTTVRYLQETSFTNAAAMVGEAGSKPEMTWALAEVDATVKKIAVMARVSDEMFQDYPAVRDYINQRIPFAVRQREELQLLNGDGTGNNLLGILQVSGILTQATGTDTNVDAIYKAITKVRTQGFWEPDAIVMDPTNWTPIQLSKATTGQYLYGSPGDMAPMTLFGRRIVLTVNMGTSAANTAIVGAWRLGGTVFYKEGIRIEATNSDASDFQFNRIALRAEQRETAAWWRPKAFCTVTGLST